MTTDREIKAIYELQDGMSAFQRIETKIDDIRDKIHEVDMLSNMSKIRQAAQEDEIKALKSEVAMLKTAHDKAAGAWKLMTLPGVISLLYAIFQILQKT